MAKLKSPIFWCITGTPFPKADDSVYGINKVLNIKVRFRLSDSPFTKSGDELHENHPFEVLKRALYIRNPVLSSAERRAMGLIGSSIEVGVACWIAGPGIRIVLQFTLPAQSPTC